MTGFLLGALFMWSIGGLAALDDWRIIRRNRMKQKAVGPVSWLRMSDLNL